MAFPACACPVWKFCNLHSSSRDADATIIILSMVVTRWSFSRMS